MLPSRPFRAGDDVEDFCRACKTDRMHTVIAADGSGRPLRVTCGFCRSEHNFRGGPRIAPVPRGQQMRAGAPPDAQAPASSGVTPRVASVPPNGEEPAPTSPAAGVLQTGRQSDMSFDHELEPLEALLRRVIREEAGLTPAAPSARWRGGTIVLRPGTPGLQEKTWPVDTFFHKIVMIRNRLRNLEAQLNGSDLPDDAKIKMQSYISGCYGSLTSFNLLFAEERDQFKGSGGD